MTEALPGSDAPPEVVARMQEAGIPVAETEVWLSLRIGCVKCRVRLWWAQTEDDTQGWSWCEKCGRVVHVDRRN